jgi:hypothetical protein
MAEIVSLEAKTIGTVGVGGTNDCCRVGTVLAGVAVFWAFLTVAVSIDGVVSNSTTST